MVQPINVRAINQGLRRWPINSTTNLGAGGAVDAYLVNSLSPDTVADFAGVLNSGTEYYRVGGSETTFASMFTYGGSSLGVMTDSDGNLKWKPHNLIAYSDAFNSWTKLNAGDTLTANATTDPDGGATADLYVPDTASSGAHLLRTPWAAVVGVKYKQVVWAKPNGYDWLYFSNNFTSSDRVWFNVTTGAQGSTSGSPTNISITAAGNGWYKCEFTTAAAPSTTPNCQVSFVPSDNTSFFAGDGTSGGYVWGAHVYRSDLGGMANNPDRGDSYVPTTSAARYLPRRNHYRYNGTSYTKKGILLESAAATNLLTHSNDFGNAAWTKDGVTVTTNQSTGPDGNTSLALITVSAATAPHQVFATSTITAGSTYCSSFYVRAGTQRYISVRHIGGSTSWVSVTFDLQTGTSTQQSTGTTGTIVGYDIENVGSGLYRVHVAATVPTATTGYCILEAVNSGTPTRGGFGGVSYLGAGETFYAGFAGYELGSVPTSYIPTSGSTATRAAETLTIAGSNMAYSATAMSFHQQGEANVADGVDNTFFPSYWFKDSDEYLLIGINTGATNQFRFASEDTSSAFPDNVVGGTVTPGLHAAYNVALRTDGNEVNGAVAGTALTPNTSVDFVPGLSATAYKFNEGMGGTIAIFRQAGVDWTDAGIEEATS